MMVDILCGALGGANWGPFAPPFALRQEIPERSVGKGIGHFFGAMRIDGFIDADEFKRHIDDYVRVFRATKPAPGTNGPLIPGDPEREAEHVRRKSGVPLILPVIEDLQEIRRLGAERSVQDLNRVDYGRLLTLTREGRLKLESATWIAGGDDIGF